MWHTFQISRANSQSQSTVQVSSTQENFLAELGSFPAYFEILHSVLNNTFTVMLARIMLELMYIRISGRILMQKGSGLVKCVSMFQHAVTSSRAVCACPSFQPQFMSAICGERLMLVQVSNKSTFFGPMQQDPLIIREKLFQGIDRDYNVSFWFH